MKCDNCGTTWDAPVNYCPVCAPAPTSDIARVWHQALNAWLNTSRHGTKEQADEEAKAMTLESVANAPWTIRRHGPKVVKEYVWTSDQRGHYNYVVYAYDRHQWFRVPVFDEDGKSSGCRSGNCQVAGVEII